MKNQKTGICSVIISISASSRELEVKQGTKKRSNFAVKRPILNLNKKTELRIVKSFVYSNAGKKRLGGLGVGEKSVNLVEPNQEHNTSYIV